MYIKNLFAIRLDNVEITLIDMCSKKLIYVHILSMQEKGVLSSYYVPKSWPNINNVHN